jgi:thymidylate kinase
MEYIVVEGLPGSGKSTLTKDLAVHSELERIGEIISPNYKEVLIADVKSPTLQYFINSDERKMKLLNRLTNKKPVISDRCHLSTVAYTMCTENEDLIKKVKTWSKFFVKRFRSPDLFIYLDINPKISIKRKRKEKNNPADLWSYKKNLKKTLDFYKEKVVRNKTQKVVVINGLMSYEEVYIKTVEAIKRKFPNISFKN